MSGDDVAMTLLIETKCSELIKGHAVIEIDAAMPISKACSVRVDHPVPISFLF